MRPEARSPCAPSWAERSLFCVPSHTSERQQAHTVTYIRVDPFSGRMSTNPTFTTAAKGIWRQFRDGAVPSRPTVG